ncbi:MAG TPA: DUF3618 domain-containing protein [Mycobacteriales bacterium]|nr:DUF3618 domain-containing protein [Mycobacteriales bacterium]
MTPTRKPDVIVREIEQTRAELAETIDAITERLNPKRVVERRGPALAATAGAAVVVAGVVAVRRRH